jgi:hypothetical protein
MIIGEVLLGDCATPLPQAGSKSTAPASSIDTKIDILRLGDHPLTIGLALLCADWLCRAALLMPEPTSTSQHDAQKTDLTLNTGSRMCQ